VSVEQALRALVRDEVKAALRDDLPGMLARVQPEDANHEEYVSPERAANIAGIGLTTIRKLIRSGKVPCVRVGRLMRVHVRDLDVALRAGVLGDRPSPAPSADEQAVLILERVHTRGARR
jgi:excisionase family DNA binding protein